MYNNSLPAANKIIATEDLIEIFEKMNEKLLYYKKVYNNEELQNRMLDYKYQIWSFKDNNSYIKADVGFYDNTEIKFENYNNFITTFNNRLSEIKKIYLRFYLSYSIRDEFGNYKSYNQHIVMWIYENKLSVEICFSDEDKKMDDIYELITEKILNSPEKYDMVIRKKRGIKTTVGLSLGFIPALIISTACILAPIIRNIYATSYVLYPIFTLFIAFFIGESIASLKLNNLYKNILPEQKYMGYDSSKGKKIYRDDVEKYTSQSEIIIGKNVNNLKSREEIKKIYYKYKKFLPIEIIIMLLISIIVIFLK